MDSQPDSSPNIESQLQAIAAALKEPFDKDAWVSYTPTFDASIGTPTTVTLVRARYKKIGTTVHLRLDFTVTNKGTAAGHLQFTLPFPAIDTSNSGYGTEFVTAGVGAQVWTKTTTKGALTKYDGTTGWVNAYEWLVQLTYEVA